LSQPYGSIVPHGFTEKSLPRMPVGPPLPIDTMFDIQEQTAHETREELQHNLSVITEMNSLPVFGVGQLPSIETLMVSYDGLVKSAKARKSRGVQEDDRDTMLGHEKFYSKEKVCYLSPGMFVCLFRTRRRTISHLRPPFL
jgi:hypothetical protein